MAKLVEHGLHLAEGHEAGHLPDGRGLVAHHVRHRQAHAPASRQQLAAAHHLVHPGPPALLRGAGVRVEVEVRHRLPRLGAGHLVQPHIRVPHRGLPVRGRDGDLEEALSEREHPVHHRREREVRAQLLLLEVVLGLLEALGPEGDVPVLEAALLRGLRRARLGREGLHVRKLLHGGVVARSSQLLQQVLRLRQRRHLRRHRHLGVVGVAEERGLLLAEAEDGLDDGGVVALPAGGAADERLVELLAQGAVRAVGHHGQVRGEVQGHHPGTRLRRRALVPVGHRRLRRQRLRRLGEARHLRGVGDGALERLGAV
mmetsp:Transcript_13259/g.28138  ORF Transcript_13259/g.28138 Transcript_13259/m.28138 type:complete len:314 (-) Transcript_13259:927-1868(-)